MTIHIIKAANAASAASKRTRGRCVVSCCRRPAARDRDICNTCRDRAWRAAHPEHHLWNNMKKSAKRRGVVFTISLAEFKDFCAENNLVEKIGRGPLDATVDRRDATLGYERGNLRVLSNAENGRLGGLLANSGHRAIGQAALPLEAAASNYYTPEEDPLRC